MKLKNEMNLVKIKKSEKQITNRQVDMNQRWSYGVMVSTLDSESNNPSSNLGRTLFLASTNFQFILRTILIL